jgi:hypothetical protein
MIRTVLAVTTIAALTGPAMAQPCFYNSFLGQWECASAQPSYPNYPSPAPQQRRSIFMQDTPPLMGDPSDCEGGSCIVFPSH